MKLSKLFSLTLFCLVGCVENSSDSLQQKQQETILQEATSAVGMPAIKNFRERRMVKMLLELRDQEDLSTYTYVFSEMTGKWVFFCNSIGYGIPYATQFTNPQKLVYGVGGSEYPVLPQADPNGLFSPGAADGTWIMCKDPKGTEVKPVFVEPRTIVSPFELPSQNSETLAESKTVSETKKAGK